MPRERIKIETVYKYEELDEKAKEKATEHWRSTLWDSATRNDDLSEDFAERLDELGYPTGRIGWNLSYSQGDGMAFYGLIGEYDLHKVVGRLAKNNKKMRHFYFKKLARWIDDGLAHLHVEIYRIGSFYHHWNTMRIEAYEENSYLNDVQSKNLQLFFDWLRKEMLVEIQDVSRELERFGYDWIESLESEENFLEEIKLFKWEFYENGKIA